MALMVGAMTIHGIVPGPQVMTKQPELFWGMIASMWIGNLMLVVINLPLVGLWVRLLRVPYRHAVPGDHDLLLHRRLLGQQLAVRRDHDGASSAWSAIGWSSTISSRRRCCSASCSAR